MTTTFITGIYHQMAKTYLSGQTLKCLKSPKEMQVPYDHIDHFTLCKKIISKSVSYHINMEMFLNDSYPTPDNYGR